MKLNYKQESRMNIHGLVEKMNRHKKTNLQYYLVRLAAFEGYEFVVSDGNGVISRTHISVMDVVMDRYDDVIAEYKKAEKVYSSKLFKALK